MTRSIKSNFIWQASYQVLLIVVPLVTTPYLSRTLGAEGVGAFSYTQAISSYFVMFAMLGMSTYGVREIAAKGNDRDSRSRSFWSAYASQVLVGGACCIAYLAFAKFVEVPGGLPVAMAWGGYVLSAPLDVTWLLFGCEEFRVPTVRSIATKLATLVIIFGFVKGPNDLWVYCAAISGSHLVNQLLVWPFVRRYVDWFQPKWSDIKGHLVPNLMLFIPVIAVSLYTLMDKILLGAIAGMEQTGLFEYSEKLSKMPLAIVTAVGTVMLPRMTAKLSSGKREEALSLLEDSVWVMEAMAMALAFGIVAIASEFAPVFLGNRFVECAPVMILLAVIIPVISATNVIGRQYLVPTGRDRLYTVSVCVGAVANVVVNIALIPRMGAMGAAVATVTAELSVLFLQAWWVRGELPLFRYVLNTLPFVCCGAIMVGAVRIFASWLNAEWGMTPLGLALEVVVGIIVFSSFAYAWCVAANDGHYARVCGLRRRDA